MRFKKNTLYWCALALFWILENLAPHSTVSQAVMIVMLSSLGIYLFNKQRLEFSPVLIAYCGLVVLQILYIFLDMPISSSVTWSNLKTMFINVLCCLVIYSFLAIEYSYDKVENFFIYTALISIFIVIFLSRDTLLTGRMAHAYGADAVSYYFFGKPVSISSNGIATYCCYGFFFSLCRFDRSIKKRYLLYSAIFIIGVVLTGSRKGILMMAAFWGIYQLFYKKNSFLMAKLFAICVAVLAGYFIIIKVPVLYEIIGYRLQALFDTLMMVEQVTEGSISARMRYASYAKQAIQQYFWFGNGLGWFKSVYGNVTENNYYELIVGCGIFGLLINYSFVPSAVKRVWYYRDNRLCFTQFVMLIILLVMQWGSVVYLSRNVLIYQSLFFLTVFITASNDVRQNYNLSI